LTAVPRRKFINYPLNFVVNYDDCPANYVPNFVPNYSGAATRQVEEAVSKWEVVLDKVLEIVWEDAGP